jgi:hypothetical protein
MLGETLNRRFHLMPRGRPLAPLTLTPDERETLQQWVQRRKTAQALALARFFGTSAKFWLGLQTDYDLDVAADKLGRRLDTEVRELPQSRSMR